MSAAYPRLDAVSRHAHAWLEGNGAFGVSNAGVIAAGGEALLVDTLFDLAHTRRMLHAIDEKVGAPIRRVVNTHHNGDHCWGNQLLPGAEIVGHRLCAEEMRKLPPSVLESLRRAPVGEGTRPAVRKLVCLMRDFDFSGIEVTPPTTLLDGDATLAVGDERVELLYVGPAHTAGDVVAWLPDDGVAFAGDVLFRLCTPVGWEGTYATWIRALERVAALPGLHTIVPGHGPLCGPEGALELRDYLVFARDEAGRCFERGMSLADAARAIDLGPYAGWIEPERIVFQIDRAWRELRGEPWNAPVDFLGLMDVAAELEAERAA
ncbi:MAG TPA: MBL fold metallo-hydrolase [Myxococcota bacterium]|nr:MBL fold metallo-hydrolase [Myxococcota bacterium]